MKHFNTHGSKTVPIFHSLHRRPRIVRAVRSVLIWPSLDLLLIASNSNTWLHQYSVNTASNSPTFFTLIYQYLIAGTFHLLLTEYYSKDSQSTYKFIFFSRIFISR